MQYLVYNVRILWYQYFTVNCYVTLPGYNDIALCNTSCITSDILWYQYFITSDILWYQYFTVNCYVILPGYNDIALCNTSCITSEFCGTH